MLDNINSLYSGKELEKRLNIQEKYSTFDLKNWLFFLFKPASRYRILDLGCGNGKDLIYFSSHIDKGIGVDFSKNLIQKAEKHRTDLGIENIEFIAADCNKFLFNKFKFDVIYSNFAFYYFKEQSVLLNILKMLKKNGAVYICGSPEENAPELSFLISSILKEKDVPATYKKDFSDVRKYFKVFKRYFKHVDFYRFINTVRFPGAAHFLEYLQNTTLYQGLNESKRRYFLEQAELIMKQKREFTLTKICDVLRASE